MPGWRGCEKSGNQLGLRRQERSSRVTQLPGVVVKHVLELQVARRSEVDGCDLEEDVPHLQDWGGPGFEA